MYISPCKNSVSLTHAHLMIDGSPSQSGSFATLRSPL